MFLVSLSSPEPGPHVQDTPLALKEGNSQSLALLANLVILQTLQWGFLVVSAALTLNNDLLLKLEDNKMNIKLLSDNICRKYKPFFKNIPYFQLTYISLKLPYNLIIYIIRHIICSAWLKQKLHTEIGLNTTTHPS